MKTFISTKTSESFSAFDQMFWFSGVIESISDPAMQGRCQVRCIGYHPDDKTLVPTEDLPWAHVMLPTTSAGVSGIGATHGLLEGSWVIGFFSDGREAQQPIILGTIPGNPNPSRIQQTLLDSDQSIQEAGSESISGLIQSTDSIRSASNSSIGAISSTNPTSVDLTSVQNLLTAGLANTSSLSSKTVYSIIGASTDLQASQLYSSILSNDKLNSTPETGKSVLSYLSTYGSTSYDSLVGVSPNSSSDVATSYETAITVSKDAGLLYIEHNNTRKKDSGNPLSAFKGLDIYDFVITSQGEVFPKSGIKSKVSDALSSITNLGSSVTALRICLIGGLPDLKSLDNTAGFYDRFTIQQFKTLKRLLTALLKKFPRAIIAGSSNLSTTGRTGFDPTEVFKDIFPNNINKGPTLAISGVIPTEPETQTSTITKAFQDPRGTYPAVNYGQDYSILARTNSITSKQREPKLIQELKGNISKFSVHEPRDASNRTAVGVIDPKQITTQDWGGEYTQLHVIRETPGGHGIYADDTPGKERVLLHSSTGSAIDMLADGSITTMSQGNLSNLVDKDHTIVINGQSVETINGTKKLKIAGDFILEVGGKFSVVSKDMNEFISGTKSSVIEGFNQTQAKAGYQLNVGRDAIFDIGGNRTDTTIGSFISKTATSRLDVITGTHTTKSNYSVDITLGNRSILTKGSSTIASNGTSSIFSKGDLSLSSAGSLSAKSSGNMSLDASHISMQEGSNSVQTYDYPETIQPISSMNDPESNPSATDFTFGQRHEIESHDEVGSSRGSSRSAFNSGSTRNPSSAAYSGAGSKTVLTPTSLGSTAGTGCQVANGLVNRGMSPEAASAYAGAFMQESRLDPTVTNSIGATGLAQWLGTRKQNMQAYLGSNSTSLDGQLDYVMHELKTNPNNDAGGAATTWQTTDFESAIKSAALYERFNGYKSAADGIYTGNEWGNRAGYATSIYKECFGKELPASTSSGLASTSGATGPNTGMGTGPEQRGSEKDIILPPQATKYTDRNQKISEYFTLGELLQSGVNRFELLEYYDTPNGRISADEIVANLSSLSVNVLDVISRRLGKVTILSGLRPASYNNGIGGAKNSQHMYGRAADIRVAGYTPSQVHSYINQNIPACKGLGLYATWVHVDVRPGARAYWNG